MPFPAFSIRNRLLQLTLVALCLTCLLWFSIPTGSGLAQRLQSSEQWPPPKPNVPLRPKKAHPIDELIAGADKQYKSLLAKESKTVGDAAEAYRQRRGRQPPPGFDAWFKFASNASALIVEDFFDRIYEDLAPFWAVPAKQIREQANDFVHKISVRDGKATGKTDIDERPWINLWQDMVQSVAKHLPDVDVPINVMDESRIVVPWEEVDGYMKKESLSRKIVPAQDLKTEFGNLRDLDMHPPEPFDPRFDGAGPYWPLAVVGCPPESPARKGYFETDFTQPPPLSTEIPDKSYKGYVQNWTYAQSPCDHPEWQGLHGTFVEPISISNTKEFFPLFGGSKLPMNNEILLPAAMYWTEDPFYSGGKEHGSEWEKKKDALIWRGSASGGRNKEENWTRFQRHRFISMINATEVKAAVDNPSVKPRNFVLPGKSTYDLAVLESDAPPDAFSEWVSAWSDAAAVHLLCFPGTGSAFCPYTDLFFQVKKEVPMKEQYQYKYLPDIDGNSFSGRYRGFLGSTSLPIKATIYQEWHDNRLIPWKHFVPMDNTFIDIFGLMEYFVGNAQAGVEGHDEEAKKIALEGKEWTEKVLRKEDMSVYVLRLLLEYARLCEDDREKMGWAEHTTKKSLRGSKAS
ncbi:glycosyltransferase family 90 protein [Zymoseptoria brevis]|uniref:Glycosyltransferase family 90 protein n=1 Tax=Zymoseptoria brevis TaxID=1047168 RepID=A0A0F4GLL8_9PEZI|nr:glycosyltransferase family 90 protein [Zymoseptoria brevis]